MKFKTAEITIKYTVDLDGLPGWGNDPADWIALANEPILRQTHYNTKAETVSVVVKDKPVTFLIIRPLDPIGILGLY